MKKIRLLLVVFGLLAAFVSSGQTSLTYRFANPKVTFSSPNNYFEFDIDVKAGAAVTYFEGAQANINFNNTTLSTSAIKWTLTLGSTFAANAAYGKVFNLTGTAPNVTANLALTTDPAYFTNTPWDNSIFNELATSYQTLFHVKVLISSITGTADIGFILGSMTNQQFNITAPSTAVNYSPVTSETADFMNTYVARIYSTTPGWTQTGGGTAWTSALNTSIWDGNATLPAGSLSNAGAVRIHSGATLTVPPTGQLTAASLENNTVNGLTVQSDITNTGSLIATTASGAGTATVQRYMAAASWRIATSPLSGQTIGGFLTANPTVATASGSLRGMTDYNMATNTWNAYFTNGTVDPITVGKGYLLRASASGAGVVSFNGSLNAGNTNVGLTLAGTNWNCIGNPYTAAVTKTTLLASGVFESGYTALYVYNGSTYDIVNSVSGPTDIQAGQGFMVKALSATNLAFTPSMEVHDNAAVLKSATAFPEIKLIALNNNMSASTSIKFIAGTTTGLDEGYDAGIFKSDLGLNIYTKLVEDNGIDFGLQCLPNGDFSGMIIPVGIDSKAGGEVVFSTELINLPSDCKVILEDKLSKTFTDLSKNVYKTTIEVNSVVADRFQIHTSYQTTGFSEAYFNGSLSAYAIRNVEIRVKGNVSNQAVASLYDVQGRLILTKRLEAGSLNVIKTPNIKTAIYMLFVKDNDKIQGFKIPIKE